MTFVASSGDSTPCAHADNTADDASCASPAALMSGRSKVTSRSRRGGTMRSKQSRSAGMLAAFASSTPLSVIASASPIPAWALRRTAHDVLTGSTSDGRAFPAGQLDGRRGRRTSAEVRGGRCAGRRRGERCRPWGPLDHGNRCDRPG